MREAHSKLHTNLDTVVDRAYRKTDYSDNNDRLESSSNMYEKKVQSLDK